MRTIVMMILTISYYFLTLLLYSSISFSLKFDRLLSTTSLHLPSTEKILLSEHYVSFDSNQQFFSNERISCINNELCLLPFTVHINASFSGKCQNNTDLLQHCVSEKNQLEQRIRVLNSNMSEQGKNYCRQYSFEHLLRNKSSATKYTISDQFLTSDHVKSKSSAGQDSIRKLKMIKSELEIQSLIEKILHETTLHGKLIAVFGFHFTSSAREDLLLLLCALILVATIIYWFASAFKGSNKSKVSVSNNESVEAHPCGEGYSTDGFLAPVMGMPLEIVATDKASNLNEELAQMMQYNRDLQLQLQQLTVENVSLLGVLSESQHRNAIVEEQLDKSTLSELAAQLHRLEGNFINTHRILGKEAEKISTPPRKKIFPSVTPQKGADDVNDEKKDIEVLKTSMADLRAQLAAQVSEAKDNQQRTDFYIRELNLEHIRLAEEKAQYADELEKALLTISSQEMCISELRDMSFKSSSRLEALNESLAMAEEDCAQSLLQKDSMISGIEGKLKDVETRYEDSQFTIVELQEQRSLLKEKNKAAGDELEQIKEILGLIDMDNGDDALVNIRQFQKSVGNPPSGSGLSIRCSEVLVAMLVKMDSLRLAAMESSGREQDMKASLADQLDSNEVLKTSLAAQLAAQVSEAEDYQQQADAFIRELNGEIIRLTEEKAQYADELEKALLTISSQEMCISELRDMSSSRLEALSESLAMAEEDCAQSLLRKGLKISDIEGKLKYTETKLEDSQSTIKALQEQHSLLKEKNKAAGDELEQIKEDSAQSLLQKDSMISGIEGKLKDAETRYEDSQFTIVELQEQRSLLKEKNKAASDELEQIKEILGLIDIDNGDDALVDIRQFQKSVGNPPSGSGLSIRCSEVLVAMLGKMDSLRLAAMESSSREQDMKASLADQLATANKKIRALEQDANLTRDSHLNELRGCHDNLQRIEEVCREKEKSIFAVQAFHDQLREHVQKLEEQIVALTTEKTANELCKLSLEGDLSESSKRIEDLERINEDLLAAANLNKGSSQRLFDLQNEHQKCRVILSEREYSLRNTTKELHVAQGKLSDQVTKLIELSDRNATLEASLHGVEMELTTLLATEKGVLHQRLAVGAKQLSEAQTALESFKTDVQMNSAVFGGIEEQCQSLKKHIDSIKMSLQQYFEAHADILQAFVDLQDSTFDASFLTPQKVVEERRVAALVASFAKSKVSPHAHSTSLSKMDAVIETPKKTSVVIMDTLSTLPVELSKILSLTTVLQRYVDFMEQKKSETGKK